MENTQLVTAGTLALAGSNISNPIKATLGDTTKVVTVEVVVTNGAVYAGQEPMLDLFVAFSNEDGTAAALAAAFGPSSIRKTVKLKSTAGAKTYINSKALIPCGAVVYIWLGHGLLPADANVDIYLNEIQ